MEINYQNNQSTIAVMFSKLIKTKIGSEKTKYKAQVLRKGKERTESRLFSKIFLGKKMKKKCNFGTNRKISWIAEILICKRLFITMLLKQILLLLPNYIT